MARGIQGTYVIAWSQVLVDGMPGVHPDDLLQGVSWAWRGEAVRVDGPAELLLLGQAEGQQDIRARAAKVVKKLVGATVQDRPVQDVDLDRQLGDSDVLLTDGTTTYTATLIETPGGQPLVMFVDELPPADQDLWVVDRPMVEAAPAEIPRTGGIICFTDSTVIETPDGAQDIAQMRPGDLVQTKDSGAQQVLWIGTRRISGARLHVMPQLRPIRIRAGALGHAIPKADMLVAPHQRVVVRGQVALDLFNTAEVLVAAKDLINGRSIYPEPRMREVTYHHILLERHEILWTNGLMTESCHPAHTDLLALDANQRQELFDLFPDLQWGTDTYGDDARRSLNASEAALLSHAN